MRPPKASDVADLVRLPSVLSVPGDVLLGAATSSGKKRPLEVAGLTAASSCLYLAGMALNDFADRAVDATERPGRPIPSGRVAPGFALRLATGLTAAGLGSAYVAGGRRSLGVAFPLAATVWGYDLAAKKTLLGPPTMAAARVLDVLMGAGGLDSRSSLPNACVVGGHTFLITLVSRKEARGGGAGLALGALAGTTATTAFARFVSRKPAVASTGAARRLHRAVSATFLAAYAASLGRAELAAARRPDAAGLQRIVGTGVLGTMPLEAGMLAGAGSIRRALGVAAGWPLAWWLSRRRSVT